MANEFVIKNGFISNGTSVVNGLFNVNTFSATTYLNLPVSNFTGGSVSGATNFTNGLTANTISATTYQNLPQSATTYVTGFTYTANTFTIRDNSGSTFNTTVNTVTGLTVSGKLSVGTSSSSSAVLEVSSNSQGFLPPRMTTTEKQNILSATTGLIVYDTTLDRLNYKESDSWEDVARLSDVIQCPSINIFNYYNLY
jgi:hypothetical protein